MQLREKSAQIKDYPFWEASIDIKKKFFLIRLHSSTFVYTRPHSSSDLSTSVVYTCLRLSTLV